MTSLPMPPKRSSRIMSPNRRSMISTASYSDDEDAITPCPSPPPAAVTHEAPVTAAAAPPVAAPAVETHEPISHPYSHHRRGSAWSDQLEACKDGSWHFDPADGQRMDDEHLWRRMLAIQRAFHCYNSARMSAALAELEMGVDVGRRVPSRTCLNLMNDSISELPEDAKRQLDVWLHGVPEPADGGNQAKHAGGGWKRNFHGNAGF